MCHKIMKYSLFFLLFLFTACQDQQANSQVVSCPKDSNLDSRAADPRCDVFWDETDKYCQGPQSDDDLCHEKWDEALTKCNNLMGIRPSPPKFIFISKAKAVCK